MASQQIQEVTDLRATGEGYNLLLEARGKAAGGAGGFALRPRAYENAPDDGVLDLDFVAEAANENGGDGARDTGAVTLALENLENYWGHGCGPLRGVRVHAKTNSEEIQIP